VSGDANAAAGIQPVLDATVEARGHASAGQVSKAASDTASIVLKDELWGARPHCDDALSTGAVTNKGDRHHWLMTGSGSQKEPRDSA
jgi:hypothetical protein